MSAGNVKRSASLSECGRYRYDLGRIWDEQLPTLGVVMLNPSTADADTDDNTIRKVIGFAQRLGYGGIIVCNLFAFRATEPDDLWTEIDLRGWSAGVGLDNDEHTRRMMERCPTILRAWGAVDRKRRTRKRASELVTMGARNRWFQIASTKDGDPRHPLYLKYELVEGEDHPGRAK